MLVACGPAKLQTTDGSEGSSGNSTTSGTSGSEASAPTSGATTSTSTTTTTTTGPCDTVCSTSNGDNGGTSECDVYKQDCAPGEKCTVWADNGGGTWNATKCVPVNGDKVPGDICTTDGSAVSGIDDCEAGTMCWDVDRMNMGICVAFCTGTSEAPVCDGDLSCTIFGDSLFNLCLPACDPLVQDCPGDDLCLMIDGSFKCVIDASGDMGKTNDPCDLPNACDKGLACIKTASASSACMQDSQGCCQPFCNFAAMDTCPNADQMCVQWFESGKPIPPGFEDVGVCAIPM